jgi:phosphatidylinositol glycan class U
MTSDLVLYSTAVIIRQVLVAGGWFIARPEISTPLNSWSRLTEGVHLHQSGLSPYSGVVFHETPLALFVFSLFGKNTAYTSWLFILGDLLTSFLLSKVGEVVAKQRLVDQEVASSAGLHHPEARPLLATLSSTLTIPRLLSLSYLLNPYIIASCVAMTSTVWTNLLLSAFLLSLVSSHQVLACISLSLATYQSLYPALLLVPLCLKLVHSSPKVSPTTTVMTTLTMFSIFLASLLLLSAEICGDWSFLHSVYGFILTVPELTPNMGIFWYFFTEMFDHFRVFFVWTFQLNLLLYVAPLSIKFPSHPLLLSTTMIGLIAVFKSYPSTGDVGLFLSLLPLFSHLLPFMKQTFIILCMLLATTVLAPIAWQLWIYNNSANANYYFAINLVYSTAQIFLITDLLFGQVKRQFYITHGFSILENEDKEGRRPILQLK